MSRLFWKFFLAFWLTLLAANLVVGVGIWLHRAEESSQRSNAGGDGGRNREHNPVFMLDIAASLYQHEGEPRLRQLLQDWQHFRPDPLYAVDAQGRDLLGRPLPAEAADTLEKARAGVAAGTPGPWRQATAPDGAPLLLFMPEHRPFHVPGLIPLGALGPGPHAGPPPGRGPEHPDNPAGPGEPPPRRPPLPWLLITSVLAASLVFSALLAWTIVGPIRRLRQGFREVAAGRLETRLGRDFARRKDEIGELGQEFDAMAGQLERLMATQRHLFHDVSHELRSPLARLQAAVGLAHQHLERQAAEPPTPEQLAQLPATLERIERETQRLDELVDELLTLARLDSGTSGPLADDIDVAALLHSIVEDASFEGEAQGRRAVFAMGQANASSRNEEAPLLVRGRAELLGRALENVIRNGIKFTAPESEVTVTAQREDAGTLHIVVADAGPGVPAADLEAIFQPFFRSTEGSAPRGYGLGLAIARRAVEAHGGRITAANQPTGGLRVDIYLPLIETTSGSPA